MGSGAFLVETVRQLGDHVVAAWRREGRAGGLFPAHGPAHTAADAVPLARRLVAQRCIYGIDKNPHAVTLAKLSLWLVTLAKDKPFTFLDHALRHGDSLVGLDLDQLTAFHWEPDAQLDVIESELRQVLDEAIVARERIVALAADDSPAAQREKERLLRDAADAVSRLRLIGDLVLGAFFSSDKPKEREAERVRRRDRVAAWLASGRDAVPDELAEAAAEFRAQVPALHWMIELPEVFWAKRKDPLNKDKLGGHAWMDAFLGNPPFAGKNNIASVPMGAVLLDWLKQIHAGSHGNSDYSAHFFRRCWHLLGDHGTMGLIATNTIAQGDTRATGLQVILDAGATIYDATRSMPWPGDDAAVTVAIVHIEKGRCTSPRRFLDGLDVLAINSRLRAGNERPDPVALKANANKSFQGSIVLGMGFVLTVEERDALIAKSKTNAERIFPYLGGDEVNSSPTQAFDRYVINFGDMTIEEAGRWPDLLQIVREKVRPEREKNNRESYRRYWWQFAEKRSELFVALAGRPRCLITKRVQKHLTFSFQESNCVFANTIYVFPFHAAKYFAVLQSRIHASWTWMFSSTMKTDLNYSSTDCFENFPFPDETMMISLEVVGQTLYDARAAYMVATNQGLTATYNQLKDPHCAPDRAEDLPVIQKLRQLHEELDRAVVAAYGWSDIPVPPYCPATDAERAAVALFEDTVIDRLFALNAELAAEERRTLGTAAPKPAAVSKPKSSGRKPRAGKNQTSMLDDD